MHLQPEPIPAWPSGSTQPPDMGKSSGLPALQSATLQFGSDGLQPRSWRFSAYSKDRPTCNIHYSSCPIPKQPLLRKNEYKGSIYITISVIHGRSDSCNPPTRTSMKWSQLGEQLQQILRSGHAVSPTSRPETPTRATWSSWCNCRLQTSRTSSAKQWLGACCKAGSLEGHCPRI